MAEGYFTPWREASEHDCHGCRYSIGRPDGFRLWCERHRLLVVFPCGWWEREAGTAEHQRAAAPAARRGRRAAIGPQLQTRYQVVPA
jgi:hypothetical protein